MTNRLFSIKNAAFVVLFLALIVLADKITIFGMYTANVATGALEPTSKAFTSIQLFAPIAGGLLSTPIGLGTVFLSQLISSIINNAPLDLATIIRFLTLVFGAYYFGKAKESQWIAYAPLLAAAAFVATTDVSAWHYALLWFIPFVCALPQLRNIIFARSLGATFTAHAMGNLWFMLFFGFQPAIFWSMLFPVTILERVAMAAGISISYIAINAVLTKYFADVPILSVNKKYAYF